MQLVLGLSNNACPWCTITSNIIGRWPIYNLFSKEELRTGTLAKEHLKLIKKNKHFRGQKFPPSFECYQLRKITSYTCTPLWNGFVQTYD